MVDPVLNLSLHAPNPMLFPYMPMTEIMGMLIQMVQEQHNHIYAVEGLNPAVTEMACNGQGQEEERPIWDLVHYSR